MSSVRGQRRPAQRGQASEAFTNRSNNKNHKDSLRSNKPRPFEAPKAPTELPGAQFLVLLASDVTRYTQKKYELPPPDVLLSIKKWIWRQTQG